MSHAGWGLPLASRSGFEPLKLDLVRMRHQGRAPSVSCPVDAEMYCGRAAQWELRVFFLSSDMYKIHSISSPVRNIAKLVAGGKNCLISAL